VVKRFDFAALENSLQGILLKNMAARHGDRAAIADCDTPQGASKWTLLAG